MPFRILLSFFILSFSSAVSAVAAAPLHPLPIDADEAVPAEAFPVVVDGRAAVILVPHEAAEVVRIAARDFAADVERVTGVRPEVKTRTATDASNTGPRVEVVFASDLAGHWEAFRLSATSEVLTIAGSDRRALAYGLYELSKRIGVSPWYWWADVPPKRQAELRLATGAEPVDAPAVRYRGVFLNDEGWGLEPWARLTHEPETGTIGPKTYGRLFELLLRLRANTLWPAMHPCTTPFHLVPGNADVADAYAIVLGSSHAEPMLRNNVGEWTAPKHEYDYVANREGVLGYWEERVRQRTSGESVFTLGMRGIHDSPIVGPTSQAERIRTLETLFSEQRAMLARHIGGGDPTRVAQIFVPYKEVLADFEAGLRVPNDVTLVWPDDNFGYIRRFGTAAERARDGGLGVYYHVSYLGAPMSWLWFDSLSPALVWVEMTRAYEHGAARFWVVNVGDLKAHELSTEFFLDLAWHADRTFPEAPREWLRERAGRDFGAAHADAVAEVWIRHQALATARKPEHLQWHMPLTPYQPTTLTDREIESRLDAYAALVRDAAHIAEAITPEARDAFFQVVTYPVECAAAANERYFRSELARRQRARGQGREVQVSLDRATEAEARIVALTDHYNERVAGGKWRYIVSVNGLSPRMWKRYQSEPGVYPLDVTAEAVAAAGVAALEWAVDDETRAVPPDARPGDFFEQAGVVSMHAGHPTSRRDLPSGGWRSVPGLGRTGSAMTVLPSTLEIGGEAPRATYRFHTYTGGRATAHVRLLPTHPLVAGAGLRLALAVDDGPFQPVVLEEGFDPASDAWKQRVLSNATEVSIELSGTLAAGWHELHLIAVDAGVVVDKIVLDFGGLRPSYDGPAETRAGAGTEHTLQ
ncbi:glycosyl hydrolase 115 family protein [Opitutales bacterium ASA1]|uniref:glycosyl hydrolase 115 family protein n=1 Tax=Congregicoccus parvus TaxID=3081749 RepID=UPI002B2C995B|nr:glycosyl hydrolase 115 family protein [Opitutales bacterium ASA1]